MSIDQHYGSYRTAGRGLIHSADVPIQPPAEGHHARVARGRRSYALILFVGVVTTALGVVLVVPVLVVTGVIELALYGVATVRVRRR